MNKENESLRFSDLKNPYRQMKQCLRNERSTEEMNAQSPKLLTLTDAAATHIGSLIKLGHKKNTKIMGLHISVKNTGCAGMAYQVEYASTQPENSILVADKTITLFIDNFASVFLAGSVMDYKTDLLSAGFTFKNPNVTGECGCGESFTVG